jgi:hypothetical protein
MSVLHVAMALTFIGWHMISSSAMFIFNNIIVLLLMLGVSALSIGLFILNMYV